MEQKTFNQNKLQTFLCIIALTLGVLVSAVLFSMPPVHASNGFVDSIPESHKSFTYFCSNTFELYNEKNANGIVYPYTTKEEKTVFLPDGVYFTFVQKSNNKNTRCIDCPIDAYFVSQNSFQLYYYTNNNRIYKYDSFYSNATGLYFLNSSFLSNAFGSVGQLDTWEGGIISDASFSNSIFYYDTDDALNAYLKKIVDEKIDTSISSNVPNTTDESYTFTGFSINGKTARWTGTTERSYAKEVDVEQYVKISYAWATTTEPDNLGELQSYDGEFPTSDKQLTLPWSEMESGKTDFQFIRQIKIFPCYRVPHLAYYIGQPVTIYYNTDGSIDKISNPNTPGVLDDSIPIPVLSVNNDKGTFLFANAQNNYKFELKGRFWSTDDFYVFRKMPSLVWQYKYLTLLKNSLTTWVSVGDNMSTLSTYSFGDLGKESWNDLLNTYPIENRNIITGEQQGWLSWANITGYNDAITTLKTLLSTPYSLFNGYEVYVRYYVVCDDGSIKYSKWTHYFNNLADADGSTGSIVDDASNMNNGSQSDKGLTDSDMDNVENSGNSRNDVDAKPSNDFSVEISDITGLFNQFINILKSLYSGIGQLPSLVNAIFGFLPSWASTMIGISLVVIIILRIIGR